MASGKNMTSYVEFPTCYGRLEWQRTLNELGKAPDFAYQENLREFDIIWCVKGLTVTRRNLVVTWKVRP